MVGAALGASASGVAAHKLTGLSYKGVVCQPHQPSDTILCRRTDGKGLRVAVSKQMIVVAAIRDQRVVWASENIVLRPDNP
jgi:hypothetical protein